MNSVQLQWRKSPFSDKENCVELAFTDDFVLVRDSKEPAGPCLHFTATEWLAFVTGVRSGQFGDRF
jgi:hypothetical protein